jgi:hypothetical protein
MNKIAISLVALAAMTSVSFAGNNRYYELDTNAGQPQAQENATRAFGTFKFIFVQPAPNADRPLTNAELMKRNQEKNALADR